MTLSAVDRLRFFVRDRLYRQRLLMLFAWSMRQSVRERIDFIRFLWPIFKPSCITKVQTSTGNLSTGTSCNTVFGNPITVGNMVVVFVWSSQTPSSVTDDIPNTYSPVIFGSGGGISASLYSLGNITNGPTTIHVHFSSTITAGAVAVELSGCTTTTDGASSNTGANGNPTPGIIGTANTVDYVASVVGVNDTGTTFSTPSGFNSVFTNNTMVPEGQSIDQITSTTGNFNPSYSSVSNNWACVIAAFKASGGGAVINTTATPTMPGPPMMGAPWFANSIMMNPIYSKSPANLNKTDLDPIVFSESFPSLSFAVTGTNSVVDVITFGEGQTAAPTDLELQSFVEVPSLAVYAQPSSYSVVDTTITLGVEGLEGFSSVETQTTGASSIAADSTTFIETSATVALQEADSYILYEGASQVITTLTGAKLGQYRVQNLGIEGYCVFVGTNAQPDLSPWSVPTGFSATLPVSIPFTLPANPETLYVVTRYRDSYGLYSQNQRPIIVNIGSSGIIYNPLSGPSNLVPIAQANNVISVRARYVGYTTDFLPASNWRFWVSTQIPDTTQSPTLSLAVTDSTVAALLPGSYSPGLYYVSVALFRAIDGAMSAVATAQVTMPNNPTEPSPVLSGWQIPPYQEP